MSHSTFTRWQAPTQVQLDPQAIRSIWRLVWKIVVATWLLMAVGSATRVMNAGLACPDWPLCYGQAIPIQQMNLQVFLEWFHRLDAGLIGVSTLWLCVRTWWYRSKLPSWLPIATTVSLLLIFCQAALGAFTVTELLRFDIVTAHLGTALLFFASLLGLAVGVWPPSPATVRPALIFSSLAATIAIYGQSLLGALVGSRWALHQCFGQQQLCTVMNSHLLGVLPSTISILIFLVLLWRSPQISPLLRNLGWSVAALLLIQIGLGIATFYLHLQVAPLTVGHQAIGALLFGSLVLFTGLSIKSHFTHSARLASPG